jgi:alkanesulfonate monooxygenase SsuD/methylene tetrahydromethanopterin reductase-like flavin-dependent oxidoreductase (luciferase family)
MDQLEYAEAHELIMRAWQSTEPFAFDGKYTQLRYVNLWPRPIQQPHPPVSPAARRRCATGCAT